MYLSRLLINLGQNPDRPDWRNRNWLRNSYRVHQRLSMAFPAPERKTEDPDFLRPFSSDDFGEHVHVPRSSNGGFLFRVDPLYSGRAIILVLSAILPDWDYAFHNAEHLIISRETTPFTLTLAEGQLFRFRLRANPVRNDWREPKKGGRGKRVSIGTPDGQRQWLVERLEKSGASLMEPPELVLRSEGLRVVRKYEPAGGGSQVRDSQPRLRAVLYEGALRVSDPVKLEQAVHSGIGPGKAFGFGLLSLGRIEG